uniref:MATE family efflux transporter n=1 Tax=Ndongobacter massiliensis TaxID=1871025 RepID=UPI000ACDAB43|nr:MATE family efflux transporter [Ndongobacter massiliensis]
MTELNQKNPTPSRAVTKKRHSHQTNMTEGSPLIHIVQFSLPLLFGNIFQQLYNTVDSIVVGNFVGKYALAAVGAGFPFMMALSSLFLGVGIAATVMIAQAFGRQDFREVRLITGTVYRAALIGTLPLMAAGFFLSGPVLRMMNVPDDGTLAMATQYLQIIFIGLLGTVGFNLNAGMLQGVGDSVSSVRFLIIAALINTVLDLFFVIPLGMGVTGAALATVISQWISWLLGIRHMNRNYNFFRIHFFRLPFDRRLFSQALRLGVPSALQNLFFSVGIIVLNSLINQFGTDFIAGFNGANKIDTFLFMPIQSFANAVTTFTGQNAGAGNLERIQQGRRATLAVSILFSILVGALVFYFARPLIGLFNNSPAVLDAGQWYLQEVIPFYSLLAVLFVNNSVLRGVGKRGPPMITSMVGLWLARVPAAHFIAHTWGHQYLFFSYGVGWILGVAFSLVYYYFGNWRQNVKVPAPATETDN